MKTNELRNLTTEELTKKVTECKEELFNLRMQKATGMLEKLLLELIQFLMREWKGKLEYEREKRTNWYCSF